MTTQTFSVALSVEENGKKAPQYQLDTDLNGELTLASLLEWTKATLIITSDVILKEEQAAGFDKEPILLVDGKQGKDVRTVSPLGQIQFVSRQNLGDILVETYQGLLDRSKVLTGAYKSSHYVFFNGAQVATNMAALEIWISTNPSFNNGSTIRIVDTQPYGRRLELLGVTAQRSNPKSHDRGRRKGIKTGKLVKVPNGTYQLTARSIQRKYKQNVNIKFSFVPGSSIGLSGVYHGKNLKKGSIGRPYLYPSIIFTVSTRGITNE